MKCVVWLGFVVLAIGLAIAACGEFDADDHALSAAEVAGHYLAGLGK